MSVRAPPLRFLALVMGGWLCIRAATLAPGWWAQEQAPPIQAPGLASATALPVSRPALPAPAMAAALRPPLFLGSTMPAAARSAAGRVASPVPLSMRYASASASPPMPPPRREPAGAAEPGLARPTVSRRWSGSFWLLVRRDRGGAALAPGGSLGGSQAGLRILYSLRPALALSARLYAPLRRTAGAEGAIGLDWRPVAAVPVHLLAERRQALGDAGRSDFSLTIYGGGSANLPRGLRLDGYAQAGIVGLARRDPFVDGSVRILAPAGPVEIGGAAWGAAQPGAARLDAGPQVSWRLPVRGANLRLSADWRFRVAGDALPESGPALTLASDF